MPAVFSYLRLRRNTVPYSCFPQRETLAFVRKRRLQTNKQPVIPNRLPQVRIHPPKFYKGRVSWNSGGRNSARQTVKRPFLKVKLHKREKKSFGQAFLKACRIPKDGVLGRFPQEAESIPSPDDPAPSFCLQNDGLEFPSFYPQLICVSKQHLFVQFARPYSLFRQAVGRKKFRPFLHWIGTVHLPLNRTDEQSARMKKQQ